MTVDWNALLKVETQQDYFCSILKAVESERLAGRQIFPTEDQVFEAFRLTPFEQVKVVILGQDPYHGPNQAHGLAFSVQPEVKIPPSLKNIFKAIQYDYPEFEIPANGYLGGLAKQGVLLLNATLTVEAGKPNSHADLGWERYTDKVIEILSANHEGLIFLLWGNYAIKKSALIDAAKHKILTSVHPSPLSAHRGFLSCGHFRTCNELLSQQGKTVIDWQDTNG